MFPHNEFLKLQIIRSKYWWGENTEKENALVDLRKWWIKCTRVPQNIDELKLPDWLKVVLYRSKNFDEALNALLQPPLELYILKIQENLDQIISKTKFIENENLEKELRMIYIALNATAERSSALKALSESIYAIHSLISVREEGNMQKKYRKITSDTTYEMEKWVKDWKNHTFDFITTTETILSGSSEKTPGEKKTLREINNIWQAVHILADSVKKNVDVQLQNVPPTSLISDSKLDSSLITNLAKDFELQKTLSKLYNSRKIGVGASKDVLLSGGTNVTYIPVPVYVPISKEDKNVLYSEQIKQKEVEQKEVKKDKTQTPYKKQYKKDVKKIKEKHKKELNEIEKKYKKELKKIKSVFDASYFETIQKLSDDLLEKINQQNNTLTSLAQRSQEINKFLVFISLAFA